MSFSIISASPVPTFLSCFHGRCNSLLRDVMAFSTAPMDDGSTGESAALSFVSAELSLRPRRILLLVPRLAGGGGQHGCIQSAWILTGGRINAATKLV
jgi:hypothetical protein